jgi:hypothetical protein
MDWEGGPQAEARMEVVGGGGGGGSAVTSAAKEAAARRLETQLQGLLQALPALYKGGAANLAQVRMGPWPMLHAGHGRGHPLCWMSGWAVDLGSPTGL